MATMRWKAIAVAVGNPGAKTHIAIEKARELALRCGARVTLMHVFSLPFLPPDGTAVSTKTLIDRSRLHWRNRLLELAKPLSRSGIKVECRVEWDYPVHEGIVRHVLRYKPDLLIAESHHHGKIARWFLSNTDWELIRSCPCPLWFVKKPKLSRAPVLLGAVDPSHAFGKPALLDEQIASTATAAAKQLRGKVLLATACDVQPTVVTVPGLEAVAIPPSLEQIRAAEAGARRALASIGKKFRVNPPRQFVSRGAPAEVIQKLAKKLSVDLVVMGAVSRRRMQRILIGSTAERVIDPIRTDVLIIKPSGFKPGLSRRRLSIPEGI